MPFGISPNGTIVGCYHQSDPNGNVIVETMHGFVMTAAGASLDPLARAMHTGVNPSGDITGNYSDPALGGAFRNSYIISHGAWRWFTYPGSKVTRSWDISATGDVAGWYKDSSGNYHGFLFHARDEGAQRDDDRSLRGTMTSIDVDLPGVLATYAYGINADGDIVGYYEDSAGLHGFLLSHREE